MFDGSSHLTLDNKGRLIIPARHREKLLERCGGHLVITADPDRCLLLYPQPEWEIIRQKLYALPSGNGHVRYLQRRLAGQAVPTQMDAAGRVLVTPELREYANLEKDVVLVGQDNKFELWEREAWKVLVNGPGPQNVENQPTRTEDFSW